MYAQTHIYNVIPFSFLYHSFPVLSSTVDVLNWLFHISIYAFQNNPHLNPHFGSALTPPIQSSFYFYRLHSRMLQLFLLLALTTFLPGFCNDSFSSTQN